MNNYSGIPYPAELIQEDTPRPWLDEGGVSLDQRYWRSGREET